MAENLEQPLSPTPDWLFSTNPISTASALARTALFDMGMEHAARHFYGADSSFVGVTHAGAQVSITHPWSEAIVGHGVDVDAALSDMMDRMRTLETVETRCLAKIAMTDTAEVSFTRLEQYSPKVAPSKVVYLKPAYLDAFMQSSDQCGDLTYITTTNQKNWQTQLRSVVEDYIEYFPEGRRLVAGLNIGSLSHLTPEQAVKLSTVFVQDVSKYTYEDIDKYGPTRADQSTTVELLMEGMMRRRDPNWRGNGVCRNVACNVKAVFEALQYSQAEYSMLNNTYCVYNASEHGIGYADARIIRENAEAAHAWNTFITIDSAGSAVATIIDATWALGENEDLVIAHLDQTETRTATQIMRLFEKSEAKDKAFRDLTQLVEDLVELSRKNYRLTRRQATNIREHVVTEYLRAAMQLTGIPENTTVPRGVIWVVDNELKGKLEEYEIDTLMALSNWGNRYI